MTEPATATLEGAPATLRSRSAVVVVAVVYVLGFAVAVPSALLALGADLDRWFGLSAIGEPYRAVLGLPAVLLGGAIAASAVRALWVDGKGLPVSHLPPSEFVTTGPFGRVRHPLYLGATLLFAGTGLLRGSRGTAIFATALLVLGWLAYVAGIEEPTLERRFGERYRAYASRTARLPLPLARAVSGTALRAWFAARPSLERFGAWTVLFHHGTTWWVTYGLFLGLGSALGAGLASALLASALAPREVAEYLLLLAVAMPLGGRIVWLAYESRRALDAPLSTFRRVGFVSFGAYFAMLSVVLLFSRLRTPHLDAFWLLDVTLLSALPCSALGRIGCFTYGCCYGKPHAHGLSARNPLSKVVREQGVRGHDPRVPTQLISAFWALFVAALGFSLLAAGAPNGVPAILTTLVYATGRFGLEGLRDEPRLFGGRFTRGQLVCLGLSCGALFLLLAQPFGFATARAPTAFDGSALVPALPTLAATFVVVFAICSYHRRELGRW